MAAIPGDQRKMRLTTPLGPGALYLDSITGTEQLFGLYSFELNVKSPRRNPVAFESLLGKDIRVDIELPDASFAHSLINGKLPVLKTRRFCGLVAEITDLCTDTDYCHYRLTMKPRLWLWTQKADCRIFQEQKIGDILATVLDGLNVDFRLRDDYHARPYCVQYNESTYDFAERLMSEEGMFYFFEHQYEGQDDEHRQRGEKLVVTDTVVNLPQVQSADVSDEEEASPLKFDDVDGGNRSELVVHKWHRSQKIVSTKCTLRDHSFQLPGQSLEAKRELPKQIEVGIHTHELAPIDHDLEVYEYPGQYAKHFDGITPGGGERPDSMKRVFKHNSVIARREIERHASNSVRIEGESNCPQLVPGHKFSLVKDHSISGPYLIKSVYHSAQLNADFRAGEQTDSQDPKGLRLGHHYSNRFECQPEVQPFQPRRIARPTISGFQTATVVGPEGEEIFSDKFGRIKVQFHWDRNGNNDADSSCWIRVSQVWAGNRWGAFFWPRVGHEVVVTFEDGDPDRPLIVGSVYNAKNMPPYVLPEYLGSCGIKSCSVGGNPLENFSCTVFHDGMGDEYLQIHSETHECMTSETAKLNYTSGLNVDFNGGQDSILGMFGSGSGGGPSTKARQAEASESQEGVQGQQGEEQPRKENNIQEKTAEELRQFLDAFQQAGSGAGGLFTTSLGDFGGGAKPAPDGSGFENSEGSFELVSGGSDLIRIGSDFEQIYGHDTKLVCDVESIIHSLLNPATWITGNPLFKGGSIDQVYGTQKSILYGISFDVHYGPAKELNQDDIFKSCSPAADATAFAKLVTKPANIAILTTAALALLISMAMAIAIKVVMETRKSGNWEEHIHRMQFWSRVIARELLELQCFIQKFMAELIDLEKHTEESAAKVSTFTAYGLRFLNWKYHGVSASQKAAMGEKEITRTSLILILVLGLVAVIDGLLKISSACGADTEV